jgi:ATP-binding cassette subfamily F protein uup
VTECWIFEGTGEIGTFVGGYHDAQLQRSAYKQTRAPAKPTASSKSENAKSEPVKRSASKLSYNLQRELEQLPQQLEQLESRIATLQAQIGDADFFSQPRETTQPVLDAMAQAEQDLEKAFERWEYRESLKNSGE